MDAVKLGISDGPLYILILNWFRLVGLLAISRPKFRIWRLILVRLICGRLGFWLIKLSMGNWIKVVFKVV
jgi:hypothetical protein